MADGIISIATVIMAGAIRRISIEHGLDPCDFVLFSYGGGGPLHSCALAHELSIPTIVIPPEPGNFSAIGMLLAAARIDTSHTSVTVLDETSVAAMREAFTATEKEASAALAAEFGTGDVFFEHHTEMRYRGPATQYQGSGHRTDGYRFNPGGLRERLPVPLRPCGREVAGRISGTASFPFRAAQTA
jgi:N-methylhydantoinase A